MRSVHRSGVREQAVAWLLLELLVLLASVCCIYLLLVGGADGVLSLTMLAVSSCAAIHSVPLELWIERQKRV